jgi:hypothetical protein
MPIKIVTLTVTGDGGEKGNFMSEQRGELGADRRCNGIRRREEVVAAEKKKAGVVDEEEEDGREEDCDGEDGEEWGAGSWRGEGGDRTGGNN